MLKNIRDYIEGSEFQLTLLDGRVNVVNYKELLQINHKQMILTSEDHKIIISGDDLVLSKLLDEEILITGHIFSIEVKDESI